MKASKAKAGKRAAEKPEAKTDRTGIMPYPVPLPWGYEWIAYHIGPEMHKTSGPMVILVRKDAPKSRQDFLKMIAELGVQHAHGSDTPPSDVHTTAI
ncbi:MAG: hypothetical protein ACM336_03275 [Acidobacteriota bacterium]